ncbi:hypothetical protein F2P81_020456 [Scophthalmus maximus]|uniref:Uncharacterized protein n=1 Tax=Scophthalmus maximus TaxID=52904 RepID=A0A6A4S615_SCOMX|nr:hypothetical protein F2P81_020456 [Scophthalmus maximus]
MATAGLRLLPERFDCTRFPCNATRRIGVRRSQLPPADNTCRHTSVPPRSASVRVQASLDLVSSLLPSVFRLSELVSSEQPGVDTLRFARLESEYIHFGSITLRR